MNLTFSTVKQANPQSQFTSVAYGNNAVVVIGLVSSFASTNDVDWQTLPFIGGGRVIFAANRFVYANGGFWTSTDGFNWKGGPIDEGPGEVTYGGGVFVGAGHSSIFYSFDGENWTRLQQHGSFTLFGVRFGGGRFITTGTYSAFPNPFAGYLYGASPDGVTWNVGPINPPFFYPMTYAWGNFYNLTATSPDGVQVNDWSGFSQCRAVLFAGNRLIGLRSNSPDVIITASEGFDALHRPLASYDYVTGVTNYLNDVTFNGSEYYFAGAGEILLKTQGVPPLASMRFGKIAGQTVTLSVTGMPGMTYGLQTIGNSSGVQPTFANDSLFDFTLNAPATNITVPLDPNGGIYRLIQRE